MAILTWRDVAAPQFGGAVQAAQLAAGLFNRAGEGLQETALGFDKAQNAGANQAALLNMLQYTDRNAYKQALAEGHLTAGLDPKRLSTDTLATLAGRAAQLQTQEVNDQNMLGNAQKMGIASYDHNRNVAQNFIADAARPALNQQLQAATGNANLGAFAGLTPGQQIELANTLGSLTDATTNKAILTQTQDIMAKVREAPNIDHARAIIMANPDVRVRNAAAAETAKLYPNMWGPDAATSDEGLAGLGSLTMPTGPAGTRQGNSYDVVYGYGAYGSPAKPLTQSTLGEVVDFGQTLIENTKGKLPNQASNIGTSASGKYQFTQGTLKEYGPKVLGSDWKTQPFTPENQDKLAEALFNDRKAGNLKATWEGLPDSTPGAYKDVPWSQMKEVIGRVESPTTSTAAPAGVNMAAITAPAQTPGSLEKTLSAVKNGTVDTMVNAIKGEVTTKLNQLDKDGVAKLFMEYGGSTKSHMQVAAELTGDKGFLKGNDSAKVAEFIRIKSEEHGVKPELVGRLLETRADRKGFWNWANATTTNLGGDQQIKDSKIDDALINFKKNGNADEAQAVYKKQQEIESIEEGQKLLKEQKQRAAKLAEQAEKMPSFAGPARQAAANLQAMQLDMARLIGALQESSTPKKKGREVSGKVM